MNEQSSNNNSLQGTTHSKALDEKFCSECGEAIKIKAEICPKCGVRQNGGLNKAVLLVVTFFAGGLGIHKFYLGKTVQGVFYLLFCWTGIPSFIAFVEFLIYVFTSTEKLKEKYPDVSDKAAVFCVVAAIGAFLIIFIVGILAAIAIPNFLRYQALAKQTEAKANLGAIYTSQVTYHAENDVYAQKISQLDWAPGEKLRYIYTISNASSSSFVVTATGNIDEDPTIDKWQIDETRTLTNITNDVKN